MKKSITWLFLLAVPAAQMFGQAVAGNLSGTVADASGAAVPKARVELQNTSTGTAIATTTDTDGGYRFCNLLVGTYNLTVNAAGFSNRSLKDIVIDLNKNTTANVTLEVGAVTTAVDVVAAAA